MPPHLPIVTWIFPHSRVTKREAKSKRQVRHPSQIFQPKRSRPPWTTTQLLGLGISSCRSYSDVQQNSLHLSIALKPRNRIKEVRLRGFDLWFSASRVEVVDDVGLMRERDEDWVEWNTKSTMREVGGVISSAMCNKGLLKLLVNRLWMLRIQAGDHNPSKRCCTCSAAKEGMREGWSQALWNLCRRPERSKGSADLLRFATKCTCLIFETLWGLTGVGRRRRWRIKDSDGSHIWRFKWHLHISRTRTLHVHATSRDLQQNVFAFVLPMTLPSYRRLETPGKLHSMRTGWRLIAESYVSRLNQEQQISNSLKYSYVDQSAICNNSLWLLSSNRFQPLATQINCRSKGSSRTVAAGQAKDKVSMYGGRTAVAHASPRSHDLEHSEPDDPIICDVQ